MDSSPCIVLFDVRPATISLMQDAGRESIELELEIGCKAESQKLFQSLASPSLSDFIRHCIANKVPNSSSLKFPASQLSSFFFKSLPNFDGCICSYHAFEHNCTLILSYLCARAHIAIAMLWQCLHFSHSSF